MLLDESESRAIEPDSSERDSSQASSRHPTSAITNWDLAAGRYYATTSPLWVHADGLLWWIRGNRLPSLVTTSSDETSRSHAGVPGAPGTRVLHGNEQVDESLRGGFRTSLGVRLGHWFDHLMDTELKFDVLWLGDGQSSGDFLATSPGDPILARPFHNVELSVPDAALIAFPNVAHGTISIETTSDFLSAGALIRRSWRTIGQTHIDWFAGYRFAQFQERLLIEETLVSLEEDGTTFGLFDDFRTWNEFHGADMGLQLWTQRHGWTIEMVAKVALGAVVQTVEIDGQTVAVPLDGGPVRSPGGLLAMPTNMGRFDSSHFAVMPELTLRLRHPISRFFTFTVGYTAVALNDVARTGEQVDLALNPTQFAGGELDGLPRPRVPMNSSTIVAHGFTIGLEW